MDVSQIDREVKFTRWLMACITVFVVITFSIALVGWFDKTKYTAPDAWGQLGDFIGGVLNPAIGACTLYWLLVSVRIQRTELGETRSALEKSQQAQEEQAHLTLLSNHLTTLNSRLTAVTDELRYRREMRMMWMNIANAHGVNRLVVGEDSENVHLRNKLSHECELIEHLEKLQHELMEKIVELAKH